ncbi:MAG: glucokinase [Naasia sp.]|nr:glucokinase [Naasia sp.]
MPTASSASSRLLGEPTPDGVLGVDVGGTSIKWSLVHGGVRSAGGSLETPRGDQRDVLRRVADIARNHRASCGAIGLAVPGTVDAVARRTVVVPNLPGDWRDFPVASELERLTGLPVALLNDARAFAWAEHLGGAGRGFTDALFVTLGTGVGGAIAFRGEILTGDLDAIGELGHVPVDPLGELCRCGGRGCLETVASATAIVARLGRTVAVAQSGLLSQLTANGSLPLTAEIVAAAARAGDPWSRDAYRRAGEAIGQAASTIALLLQLQAVVIGGGLRPAADLYLTVVQAALDQRRSLTGHVLAVVAQHGPEAGSLGAAAFAAARFPSDRPAALPEGPRRP